jgi:hypothetical protein
MPCGPRRARPRPAVPGGESAAQPFPAHLELRLDHHHQVGVGCHAPRQGGQDQSERDERQVPDDQVHRRPADRVERQLAYVGTVLDGDARIALERPGELPVAHVHGDDVRRARPEQDVGEAAGGGAGVQRPPLCHDQPARYEDRERAGELVPAPRDVLGVAVVGRDDDGRRGLHLGGGFGRDGPADGDPAGGDQLAGVLAGARELTADQFRVETAACDSCHVRFSSYCHTSRGAPEVPGWRRAR